jgi:hypothetical protein
MKKKTLEVPVLLLAIGCVLVFFAMIFFDGYGLVAGIVGLACGAQCYIWAGKLKQDGRIPFFLGFFFNVFGLLVYYIYYMLRS